MGPVEGKSQKGMYGNRCIPHLRGYLRRGRRGARSWEAGPGWSRQVRGMGENYQTREARLKLNTILCSPPPPAATLRLEVFWEWRKENQTRGNSVSLKPQTQISREKVASRARLISLPAPSPLEGWTSLHSSCQTCCCHHLPLREQSHGWFSSRRMALSLKKT